MSVGEEFQAELPACRPKPAMGSQPTVQEAKWLLGLVSAPGVYGDADYPAPVEFRHSSLGSKDNNARSVSNLTDPGLIWAQMWMCQVQSAIQSPQCHARLFAWLDVWLVQASIQCCVFQLVVVVLSPVEQPNAEAAPQARPLSSPGSSTVVGYKCYLN